MPNKFLRNEILKIVDNQMEQDNPKETKITFNRLIKSGYSKEEAKEKIAAVITEEMFIMMKEETEFNEKRFVENLKNLE